MASIKSYVATTFASDALAGAGTWTLSDASEFPDPAVSGPYWVTAWDQATFPDPFDDADTDERRVTAKSGNVLTVALEVGSTGSGHSIGDTCAILTSHRNMEPYSVRSYGALGDNSADDEPAFTAAAASLKWIYVPRGTYKLSANVTFPAGSHVVLEPGAVLAPDGGVTVTVNGTLVSPDGDNFKGGAGSFAQSTIGDLVLWGDLRATGGYRSRITGWTYTDVPTGLSDQPMERFFSGVVSADELMCRDGSVVGLWARTRAGETISAGSITCELWIAGVAAGLQATLNSSQNKKCNVQAKDLDVFSVDTNVAIRISSSGDLSPTTIDVLAGLEIEM